MTRKTRRQDRRRVSAGQHDAGPIALVREPGDRPHVMPCCAVCRDGTRWWHAQSNTPLCQECAADIDQPPRYTDDGLRILHEWSAE